MNRLIRNKILVQEIIKRGICSSQKELGVLLGYENESYFSQIMTGVKSPKNFILKLKSLLPDLNEDWLINGEGDIFLAKDDTLGIAIDDSTSDTSEQPTEDVVVISTQVLEEMTAQRQLAEQALALVQEQLEAKQETIRITQEQLTTSQEHLTTSQEQLSAEQTQTNNALASLAKSIERIDKAQAQMDELILMLKKEQARQDHHLAQLEAEHKQSQQKPTQPQQGKKSQDA